MFIRCSHLQSDKHFSFVCFFLLRSRNESLWRPAVHWRVQAQIRDGESKSNGDSIFILAVNSVSVNLSELWHWFVRFQLWSRCTPMKRTSTAPSTFSDKLSTTTSLSRSVSGTHRRLMEQDIHCFPLWTHPGSYMCFLCIISPTARLCCSPGTGARSCQLQTEARTEKRSHQRPGAAVEVSQSPEKHSPAARVAGLMSGILCCSVTAGSVFLQDASWERMLFFFFSETGKTLTTSTHWHSSSQRIHWWTRIKPNRILWPSKAAESSNSFGLSSDKICSMKRLLGENCL